MTDIQARLTALADRQTPDNPISVRFVYRKLCGDIVRYTVEPTNVKVTAAGIPLLVGYKVDDNGTRDIRSFHVPRIIGIRW